MKQFMNLLRDESGATAIEYAMIASLLSIVIIIAVRAIGNNLQGTFNTVSIELASAR